MRRKASGLGSFWGVGGSVLSGAIMLFVTIAAARGNVRLPAIFSRAVCHDILHFSARVLVSSAGQFRQFGHGRLTRSQPEP